MIVDLSSSNSILIRHAAQLIARIYENLLVLQRKLIKGTILYSGIEPFYSQCFHEIGFED